MQRLAAALLALGPPGALAQEASGMEFSSGAASSGAESSAADITALEQIGSHMGAAIGADVPEATQTVMEGLSGPGTWCYNGVIDVKTGDDILVRGCYTSQSGGTIHPEWVYHQGRLTIFRLLFTAKYGAGSWGRSLRDKLTERWGEPQLSGETAIWSWADGAVVLTQKEDFLAMWREADYAATNAAEGDADVVAEAPEPEEEESYSSSESSVSESISFEDYDEEWVALSVGLVYNQDTYGPAFEELTGAQTKFGGLTLGLMIRGDDNAEVSTSFGPVLETGYVTGKGFGFGAVSGSTMEVEYAMAPLRFSINYYFGRSFFVPFWGYGFGLDYLRVTRTDTSLEETGFKAGVELLLGVELRFAEEFAWHSQIRANYMRATHFVDDSIDLPEVDGSGITWENALLWGLND